ncbi:MAG: flagellar biosynthesis protein FlhA [Paracoccaceae bacterium]
MELTVLLNRFGDLRGSLQGAALPIGILALIAMMVLPLPALLIDTFFVFNILLSLLILMVAMHAHRPLDFSSFPNLLLIATILRLALNVASTRIILTDGHNGPDAAGHVIKAFGDFVVSGNYAVGIFVFIILVIINLVVITKGSGRVSEVSARFTLDALPGKQMAIDADLNAGILTPDEATARRKEIAEEAEFYGSMDGASKFVKGDALAGILILVINVIGGLIIGVAQHGLSLSDAAEIYVLLAIGDGLVAQIPSLLLSIATAIIVTRVSSAKDMAGHIGDQVGLSRAWLPTAAVVLTIGLVPGMPNGLFLLFAALAAGIAYVLYQRESIAPDDEAEEPEVDKAGSPDIITLEDVTDYSPISVQLGYGLIPLVDEDRGGQLTKRITSIRRDVSRTMGFVVPGVRIRDDLALRPNQYRIRIGQTIVGDDEVYPDRKLAIPDSKSVVKIEGIEAKDPSFGVDAVWIRPNQQAQAEALHYVVIEPTSVIATHLSQILLKHAADLVGQDDVQFILDNLAKSFPQLVQSVVPKIVSLPLMTEILRILLSDGVPISDMRRILEGLGGSAGRGKTPAEMAEALRPALAPLLIQKVTSLGKTMPVITLAPELEQLILRTLRQSNEDGLMLDNKLAETLIRSINETSENLAAAGRPAICVVAPQIRRVFSNFVKPHVPQIIVLSFNELPENRHVEVVASIGSTESLVAPAPQKM